MAVDRRGGRAHYSAMDTPPTSPLWAGHPTTAGEAAAADARAVRSAAAARGLTVSDACLPGVIANLVLLDHHAAVLGDRARAAS
jgi:hypothetical protein